MKTELIYLEFPKGQAIKSTIKGLVMIAVIGFIEFAINLARDFTRDWIPLILKWTLLASALSVAQLNSMKEALIYGAMVGLVVYGFYNSYSYTENGIDEATAFRDTLYGVVLSSFVSGLMFIV